MPAGTARGVARRFDPENPERGKRYLARWLSGETLPSSENRDRLAAVLGVPAGVLPLPSDVSDVDAPLSRDDLREFHRLAVKITRALEQSVVSA